KNVASVVDPIDPNNPQNPSVEVPTEGKITATKTIVGNPSSVKPNDVLTYNITLTNNFGTAKTGVTVSDAVPTTLTNINSISNGGTLTGNTINWSALTVPANGTLVLSFTATVISTLPAGTTQIKNVASVVDPIDPNNPELPEVVVPTEGKITSTKTIVGNPSSVKPNDVLTYNITLTNNFGTAKTGVTVSDAVPSTLTNITGISNGGTLTGNTINWSALTVPANGSLTLSFQATVIPTLPAGTTQIKNVASVVDPIDPNNPELPEVVVPTEGKITATKTIVGNPASVKSGEVLTYNITLTNSFGTAKTGVKVSDDLPIQLQNITNINNGGTLTGSIINWNNLTVPANGTLILSFNATVKVNLPASTTSIRNTAIVTDPIDPTNPDKPYVEVPTTINDLFIPNLYTPNGDGNNDTFVIRGLEMFAENDLIIVNRWGNEVYKQKNYQNNWTGEGLNEGTYYYVLRVKDTSGSNWKVYKGYITLIRVFSK
ncbi:T9SS type B sorting domain-containing protein, partial [Pedobacter jejuensis]